jgi:glycopeptide antibiotics resistance protein
LSRLFNARTFFVLCALFIFYATTIPWDMSRAPTLSRVHWIPGWDSERGRIWSIPDMVQNVVLFMPYGFFAYLGFDRIQKKGAVVGALIAGLLGLALSLFVELLQTMSSTRNPSATDLATNFSGALAGGVAAAIYIVVLRERIDRMLTRTVRENPGMVLLFLYLVAITAGALAPFIPTLDVGMLRHQVRLFLDDPWGSKPIGALLTDGLLFSALAVLTAFEVPGWLGKKSWFPLFKGEVSSVIAAAFASVLVGSLAIALELAQLVIIGHSPGVQDMVVAIGGAILGGVVAVIISKGGPIAPGRELGELTRRAPIAVVGFAVLAPLCRALQPFRIYDDISEGLVDVTAWNFVPFWQLFRNINLSTFRNVFEAAAIYLPLGYAIHALGRSPRFGFFMCLALAEMLEVLQIPIVDRTYDITEGIYAGLMGLLGAHALIQLRKRRVGRP